MAHARTRRRRRAPPRTISVASDLGRRAQAPRARFGRQRLAALLAPPPRPRGGGPPSPSVPPPRRSGRSGSRRRPARCRGRGVLDSEGERGDVVAPAGAVGFVDQGPHRGVHRGRAAPAAERSARRRASSSDRLSRSGRRRPGSPAPSARRPQPAASGPSALVMIERCGWSSAWASVSWPLRLISSTSE